MLADFQSYRTSLVPDARIRAEWAVSHHVPKTGILRTVWEGGEIKPCVSVRVCVESGSGVERMAGRVCVRVCVFECKLCKAKGCWGQVAPLIMLRKYCALTKLLHSHETRQFLQKFSIKRVNAGESLSEPDHCPSTNRECCLLANIVFALLTKSSAASRLTTVFTNSKIWFIYGKTDYFQQQYKLKIIIFSFNYFKMTLHSFSILVAYDIRKIC